MLNLPAILSFVLATTFSPGPNNISSASMGVLHGYRKTLRYLMGIATGFFFVMLLCGWISRTLLDAIPALETMLRIIGAGYILWLAYHSLRANYSKEGVYNWPEHKYYQWCTGANGGYTRQPVMKVSSAIMNTIKNKYLDMDITPSSPDEMFYDGRVNW